MCVIIIGADKRPTMETLKKCEEANGDGAGIAWIHTNGKIRYVKGIDAKGMHELLWRVVPTGTTWVAHFRWATVGAKGPALTHPFVVSHASELSLEGETDRVLFHNGHVSHWEKIRTITEESTKTKLVGDVSDSRVIAWAVAHGGVELIDTIPGKYAVLTSDRGLIASPRLELVHGWSERGGMHFSNLNWDETARRPYLYAAAGGVTHRPSTNVADWREDRALRLAARANEIEKEKTTRARVVKKPKPSHATAARAVEACKRLAAIKLENLRLFGTACAVRNGRKLADPKSDEPRKLGQR